MGEVDFWSNIGHYLIYIDDHLYPVHSFLWWGPKDIQQK